MILTPFPWLSTPVIQLRENLLTIGLLSFLAATYVSYRLFPTNRRPLGPPALPIIGNILSLPFEKPWLTFTAWKATFGMIPTVSVFFCFLFLIQFSSGDIVHLQGLGQSIIILNSKQAIDDLLEKRGNLYSNRPRYTVVGEMMGVDRVSKLSPLRKKAFMVNAFVRGCHYNSVMKNGASSENWQGRHWVVMQSRSIMTFKFKLLLSCVNLSWRIHLISVTMSACKSQSLICIHPPLFSYIIYIYICSAAGQIIMSVAYGLPVSDAQHEVRK